MAQKHNAEYTEQPMTRDGRIQGPSRRYRRLRHPIFQAALWTAKNPLLQRGEIGFEIDTHKAKVGDGVTYWNDLPYSFTAETEWGNIVGDIADQTDLKNALDGKVDKTSTASQVYGTDADGEQTTYNTTDFSAVDDVKVNNVSVVTNKVADIDLTSYLKNTATATDAITVNGIANTSWVYGINIGKDSRINSTNGVAIGVDASADVNAVGIGRDTDAGVRGTAIGAYAKTSADTGIAIGGWNSTMHNAVSSAKGAYQFGVGTNSIARTLNVGWYNDSTSPSTFVNYQLLDGNTGLIPDARISTNIARLTDVPTVNDATLTIQKNGTTVDTFTANSATNTTVNITVPTIPADIGAQSEITSNNMLDADLVDDSTSTNKFVTASDITTWNGKQDVLTAGTNINITGTTISATDTTYTGSDGITLTGTNFTNSGVRAVASGTANGTISVNTNGTSADVAVTGLGSAAYTSSSNYATSAQGSKADTAVQPGDDVSDLNNDAGYQTASDVATAISGKQDTLTAGTNINITGTTISATDTTYSDFTGATAADAGANGLVPAPAAGDQGKFLQGDGTWAAVDALPAQTGHSGEYLTTDGSTASWAPASVTPDNTTINKNASDELQAVATINANTAAGATNPVYDWVGTLAEHQAQDIENQHPDWICYITDDINGGTSVYTKSEVDTLLAGKVNTGHELIAYQNPTSGNNYTWYRKYADGWVEQGGVANYSTAVKTISLPIPMASGNIYNCQCTSFYNVVDETLYQPHVYNLSETSFQVATYGERGAATNTSGCPIIWFVSGQAAS